MHKSGDMNTNLTLFCFAAVGFFLAAACNCKAQQSHTDEKTKVERRALARLSHRTRKKTKAEQNADLLLFLRHSSGQSAPNSISNLQLARVRCERGKASACGWSTNAGPLPDSVR
jgi:hypothetical protein